MTFLEIVSSEQQIFENFAPGSYVVLFVSRNKDNGLHSLHGRNQREFYTLTGDVSKDQLSYERLLDKFEFFTSKGSMLETSRMYICVNPGEMSKTRIQLQHYLLDHPELDLTKIDSVVSSLIMKNPATKRWLLDVDTENESFLENILETVSSIDKTVEYFVSRTPNGFAVVCNHGFKSDVLLEKFSDVLSIHKNGSLFLQKSVNTAMF